MTRILSDVRRFGLTLWVVLAAAVGPLLRYALGLPQRGMPYPVRIRLVLERLGVTYLKLGQFLAMRFDVLPMEVCVELRRLFEDVPPLPFDVVRTVVERVLKGPLDEIFLTFEVEPIAAASIAQVHAARTFADEKLAVKVQRPGIAA